MRIFITGVGGFIGSHLLDRILADTDWTVAGIDLDLRRLDPVANHPRVSLAQGNAATFPGLESEIQRADVVIPLAAIATPGDYVHTPLKVFQVNLLENLRVVELCATHQRRVLFPSSSEVYGNCPDESYDEEGSALVLGPTRRSRWIYSCGKQMLERVLLAHHESDGLPVVIFRPFNWIGPRQDDPGDAAARYPRVVARFARCMISGESLPIVGDGMQRRCFTYIDDGIECLLRILMRFDACNGAIFNIGNPRNETSILDLARRMQAKAERYLAKAPALAFFPPASIFGTGYDDVLRRTPNIDRARTLLDWEPRVSLDEALDQSLAPYFECIEMAKA